MKIVPVAGKKAILAICPALLLKSLRIIRIWLLTLTAACSAGQIAKAALLLINYCDAGKAMPLYNADYQDVTKVVLHLDNLTVKLDLIRMGPQ